MTVPSEKVARRRRKTPPRRVPAIVEEPVHQPFIFGWGAHLSQRERESVKERFALFAGIALAVVLVGLIGWGTLNEYVIQPNNQRAADAKPVAIIGNYTITIGFFKRFEQAQDTNINNNIAQYQAELNSLQANPTANAAQISQVNQQISQYQAALGSLPTDTLNAAVDDQIAIQRGYVAGVPDTPAIRKAALTQAIHAAGGPRHFYNLTVPQSGLSLNEYTFLITGDYIQNKLQPKIAAKVAHTQLEVRASHILIASKNKALAERLFQEVKKGANFAALAKKYSIDKASGAKGGDLGFFPRGQMVAPFDKAAFSMKVGEIRLVKSQFGWHIIKVTARQKKALSASAYQQAQSSAYQTWINQQKQALHYQTIIAPTSLPNVATATPNTANQLPVATVPAQATPVVQATHHATAPSTKPATKKTP